MLLKEARAIILKLSVIVFIFYIARAFIRAISYYKGVS